VQILRAAFAWFVSVRYLGGNPWVAVSDSPKTQQIGPIQVQSTLPRLFLEKVLAALGRLCSSPSHGDAHQAQWRAGRVAALLVGDHGLGISEAASARATKPAAIASPEFMLRVTAPDGKTRMVLPSDRTREAIIAHWNDLGPNGLPCEPTSPTDAPALQPLAIPRTRSAIARHTLVGPGAGYSPGGFAQLLDTTLRNLSTETDFDPHERRFLSTCSAGALKKTFKALRRPAASVDFLTPVQTNPGDSESMAFQVRGFLPPSSEPGRLETDPDTGWTTALPPPAI
jgi:hypothetical protein